MWPALLTCLLCTLYIICLERLAPVLGLMDSPSERKHHIGRVPTVGGIAIFLAFMSLALISAGFNNLELSVPPAMVALGGLLVILGTTDDIAELSAKFRLLMQFLIATLMFFWGDIRIENLGSLFGQQDVQLQGATSYLFTVVCTIGVINAINMIDGLDGLAGSILLVSITALGVLSLSAGDTQYGYICMSLAGGLAAFLAYNNRLFRPKARIFMGDAGSMFFGFILVWLFVELTQREIPVLSSVSAGWILGLPLMETVTVMMGRLFDKRSPFDAGRDHMHHRLRRIGLSVNASTIFMIAMHASIVSIGVWFAGDSDKETPLFWAYVIFTLLHFVVSRFYLEPVGKKLACSLGSVDSLNNQKG